MRWMHISDIHMNAENNNVKSNVMRKNIRKMIEENKITVDYLFITGDYRDLKYKAVNLSEDIEKQANNVGQYICEIAKLLHVPCNKIFLVPGNHDLERRKDTDADLVKEIKRYYPDIKQSFNDEHRDYLLSRFTFFNLVDTYVHSEQQENRAYHRIYQEDDVDILCLNTAITSYQENEENQLMLDLNNLEELLAQTESTKPLMILAHHGLDFIIEKDREDFLHLLGKRRVFYLCGHYHKLAYQYDDEGNFWNIMIGTTKSAEGAYPIIATGNSTKFELNTEIKFFKYDIEQDRWSPYQQLLGKKDSYELKFIGGLEQKHISRDENEIYLPLIPAKRSTKKQRSDVIRILSGMKSELNCTGELLHLLISYGWLPVIAGILIGYALHERQAIQLSLKTRNEVFTPVNAKKNIEFQEEAYDINTDKKSTSSLYVYIQAKESNDGETAFDEYIKQKKLKNDYRTVRFINPEAYDPSFNLEASAKWISNELRNHHKDLKGQGYKKVKVHLFYNGFWGLALLLGNQLPTIFPIQLYDYDAGKQKYFPSFYLEPEIFHKTKIR